MKTAGIILILFSGTGLGLCKSMELTARLKILEKLAQLLLLLKGEIRCTGATLEDAFLDAAAKMPGEYRLFLKETAGWLQQRPGITFDEIFRECAARLLPLYKLSEEERESFLSMGEKLGYLDREMQVAQLTLLEEELGYRIKTLKSAMPKQQKTYQSMGILGGILLEVSIIFKIAAVGILVSVLSQVLKHSGREEQAFLVSLAGLLVVLFWIVPYIYELFDSIKKLFEL